MCPTHCAKCGNDFPPIASNGVAAGYAITGNGSHICYTCADEQQRADMRQFDKYGAYLSSDGKSLTTWTGSELAKVISEKTVSGGGFHFGSLTAIRAKAPDGSIWYGKGSGRGMLLRIRKAKDTHR